MRTSKKCSKTSRLGPRGLVELCSTVALPFLVAACSSGGNDAQLPTLNGPRNGGIVVFDDADGSGGLTEGENGLMGLKVIVTNPLDGSSVEYETGSDGSMQFDLGALEAADVAVTAFLPAPEDATAMVPIVFNRTIKPSETIVIPTQLRKLECPSVQDCDDLLLPDLVSLTDTPNHLSEDARRSYPSPRSWSIDSETKQSRNLLRVATITANVGDGPLIVLGTNKIGDRYRSTVQRLITPNGAFFDVPAGTFKHSDSHAHVHLDRFEEVTFAAESTATTSKISFCLTDVFRVVNAAPKPTIGIPTSLFDCGAEMQGINSNAADYYGPALPDQFVDVTEMDVDSGTISIESDPDNLLVESDETNNSASFDLDGSKPNS